jgi:hypothetical protein
MAANQNEGIKSAQEMVAHVATWDTVLNELSRDAQKKQLNAEQITDLNTLIALNQAVLDYLTQLQNTDNRILYTHFKNLPALDKADNLDNLGLHLQILQSTLNFLADPIEPNTTAFKQREKFLFNLAMILLGLLTAAIGMYCFWLLPVRFVCEFSLMSLLISFQPFTPRERAAFSGLAVWCTSFDVLSKIHGITGLSALVAFPPAVLLISPYMPLALFSLFGAAFCLLINKIHYQTNFESQYDHALNLNNQFKQSNAELFSSIQYGEKASFFSNKGSLNTKINEAYQEHIQTVTLR